MQDSFSLLPCRSIRPALLLLLLVFVFALQSSPPQLFTLRLRSSVRSSRCSRYVFADLTRCFRCQSPSSLAVSLLPLFTLHLCSPDSLFQLLVFVFASQFRASRSYWSSCFLCTLFNRPPALFRHRYSLFSSFSLHTCARAGRVQGQRLERVERVMACARLRTRESHARACYLTCDLHCTLWGWLSCAVQTIYVCLSGWGYTMQGRRWK